MFYAHNEDMEAKILNLTWDEVQKAVRKYAEEKSLEVSPKDYLSLDDARTESLWLYKEGATMSVVDFSPFFEEDGKKLKHVNVTYHECDEAKDILRVLGAVPA